MRESPGNGRNGSLTFPGKERSQLLQDLLKPCVARVEESWVGDGGSEGMKQQWEGEE